MASTLKPIEILSLGTKFSHNAGKLEVTPQILRDLYESFQSSRFVAGHPPDDQEEEFELAKAEAVEVRDGKLVVTQYSGVTPATRAVVNSGELPAISVKIRPPHHPENPTGKWVLRHIGMFGRNPVADTNLADVKFSAEHTEDVCLSAFPKNEKTGNGGVVTTDPAPPSENPTHEEPMGDTKTPATQPADDRGSGRVVEDAELAAQRQQLQQERQDFELKQARFNRRQQITPVLNSLVAEGKLLPGEVQPMQELFSVLPSGLDFEFAQGDDTVKTNVNDFLKTFLNGLPKRGPELGEVAPASDAEFQAPNSASSADLEKQRRKAAAAGLENWGK